MQSLFEKLPIGVVVYRLEDPNDDDSLRLIAVNMAATLMLRPDLEELVGKRMREAFPGVELSRVRLYAEIARNGGRRDMGQTAYADPRVPRTTFAVSAIGLG